MLYYKSLLWVTFISLLCGVLLWRTSNISSFLRYALLFASLIGLFHRSLVWALKWETWSSPLPPPMLFQTSCVFGLFFCATYIHINLHLYTYMYIYKYLYQSIYMCIWIYISFSLYLSIICMYKYVYVYHFQCVYIDMYSCMYIYIYI